jgi:pimeloyl-ACP methyl ester carboxylesterase
MDFAPPETRRRIAMLAASDDPEGVGEQTRRRMMGEAAWARLPDKTQADCRAEGRAFVVDMASEVEAPYDWADLRVPCIIGYGERTPPDTYEGSQQLAAVIGCATFTVAGAAHAAHVQCPGVFAEFVRRAVTTEAHSGRPAPGHPGS